MQRYEEEVQMHGTLLSVREWASRELMGKIRRETNRDICYRPSGRDKVVDKPSLNSLRKHQDNGPCFSQRTLTNPDVCWKGNLQHYRQFKRFLECFGVNFFDADAGLAR